MKKRYFRLLMTASFMFLVIALYRADYLTVPGIVSWPAVGVSLFLLFAGFVLMCFCFKALLDAYGFPVPWPAVLAGSGLSIFSKYVPGKIWMVLGPAMYIHEAKGYSLKSLSMVSVNGQLLTLWSGLLLGIIGLIRAGQFGGIGIAVLCAWCVVSIPFFLPGVNRVIERLLRKVLHREVVLPKICLRHLLVLLPLYVLFWGVWAVAFYFMAAGILPSGIGPAASLAFPLACTAGIAAVFIPGGLGVREGVLTAFLTWTGVPLADAVTVSVTSRLWFILGETFIFVAGVITHRFYHAGRH